MTARSSFSEEQITILDGLRYSANMAGISVDRLWNKLSSVDLRSQEDASQDIAEMMLDAWSIIDACHRFRALLEGLPGLTQRQEWITQFLKDTKEAKEFRNLWQHQKNEYKKIVERREQAWGAICWVEHINDKPTGTHCCAVAGTEFAGSRWLVPGPFVQIPRVGTRRIRLLCLEKDFYLARAVRDIFSAVRELEEIILRGQLRLKGTAVETDRGRDFILMQQTYVVTKEAHLDEGGGI